MIDCYTVLAWWHQDCQWGRRHDDRLLHSPRLVASGLSVGRRHDDRLLHSLTIILVPCVVGPLDS